MTKTLYLECKESPNGTPKFNIHSLNNSLYNEQGKNLDSYFLQRLKKNEYHPRRTELIAFDLILKSHSSTVVSTEIFDAEIKIKNCNFYLEITCSTNSACSLSYKDIIKIIRNKLHAKLDQYKKKESKNNLLPYVVFVGLYGIENFIIPIETYKTMLKKDLKRIFECHKFKDISAIIISSAADQVCMTFGDCILFNDMRLIHNPNATNKLPAGILTVYEELYIEE